MIDRSLWQAMHTQQPNLEKVKVDLKTCLKYHAYFLEREFVLNTIIMFCVKHESFKHLRRF